MVFGRFISLLLSAALVACPSVCRTGACSECPPEPTKSPACSHCQASQDPASLNGAEPSEQPSPPPLQPKNHCELGNCLCAGAVTNVSGLDMQIGHMLGVFGAFEALGEHYQPATFSAFEAADAVDHDDPQAGGRRLRLRIESLLI